MKPFLSKINSKILKGFLFSHLIIYIITYFIPARAEVENIEFIILLNLIFIVLVIFFSIFVYKLFLNKNAFNRAKPQMPISQLKFNINFSSYASLIGIFMILYDRIIIRGIDYSQGLRIARYQWRDSTGGSIISILGNLLAPFGYICIFFFFMHGDRLNKKEKRLLIIAAFISIMGHATLNGGRSNVLIAIAMAIVTLFIKNKKINFKISKFKVILILIIFVIYAGIITKSSADMGGESVKKLAELGIRELYGRPTKHFKSLSNIHNSLYYLVYFAAYLCHGQWTSQVSYSLINRQGSYVFDVLYAILRQLGLTNKVIEDGYFAKTGAFMSLPGTFYYDFGFLGIIIASSIIGILLGIAFLFLNNSRTLDGISLSFVFFIIFVIFFSPILPSYGLIYTNFVIFSFLLLGIINRLKFRRKCNWIT